MDQSREAGQAGKQIKSGATVMREGGQVGRREGGQDGKKIRNGKKGRRQAGQEYVDIVRYVL